MNHCESERSRRPRRRWCTGVLLVASLLGGWGSSGWAQAKLDGDLELRGSYDTNPLLTADDYDFELRRRGVTEVEIDDVYATLGGELHLAVPLHEAWDQHFRFGFTADRFDDLCSENRETFRFQTQPIIHLSGSVDLLLEHVVEYDNRRSNAEYLRPDYVHQELGPTVLWTLDRENQLSVAYRYEDRNYDSLEGTPYDDYDAHSGRLGFKHRFDSKTSANVELGLEQRDYAEDTRDAFGTLLPGRGRQDDRAELGASLTHLLTPETLLRVGYLYRDHRATGQFYDYTQHRVNGIWVQKLPWEMRAQSYLHYQWRDYDDQVAQSTLVNDLTGEPYQEFSDEVRSDRQVFLLLSLTKDLGKGFSCGTEFQYLNNDSDDDSNEYEYQRYSVFLRYHF